MSNISKNLKFLNLLIFISVFLFFSFSVLALDEPVEYCKLKHTIKIENIEVPAGDYVCPSGSSPVLPSRSSCRGVSHWAAFCSLDAFLTVVDIIKVVAWVVSGVAILLAGIFFATAGDSAERMQKAKKFFYGALIGVLIIVLSEFLAGLGRFFLGI